MTYECFLECIKTQIQLDFGEDFTVKLNKVIKNNSIELDGLAILRKGESITPNIYLNSYYDKYMEGETISDILEEITGSYAAAEKGEEVEVDYEFRLEDVKDRIFYRVVNYQKNRKLLKDMPNIKFLDLTITFHCLVKNDESGIGSIRITRNCIRRWGLTARDLMKISSVNTPRLFPSSIRSMNDVINEIINDDLYEMLKVNYNEDISSINGNSSKTMASDQLYHQMVDDMINGNKQKMYILSNTRGINGASVMLYKDVVRNFAMDLHCDFYVLPSSIHEVILVPYHDSIEKKTLSEMVFDINHTQVLPEEVLSDSVYYYNRITNTFQ